MRTQRKATIRAGAVLAAASLAIPVTQVNSAGPASANSSESPNTTKQLQVAGYDEDVAQEHGYRIDKQKDGSFKSVPVTDEAKKETATVERRAQNDQIDVFNSVGGACGTSHLYVGTPSSKKIQIDTGYAITLGIPAHRTWGVSGSVGSGTFDEDFSGFSVKPTWSETRQVSVGDSSSGFAQLNSNSKVVLTTGVVCTDMNPTDSW